MYDILANKWRPKLLDDLVGQDEILYIVKNILKNKYIHKSFIISGSHGIGKTSLARIFVKCINCETGITLIPCNICYCCVSIDSGKNLDSLEIDAASKTKVDDIKDLISTSFYKTYKNRFKTYIIDECHMLSINSFNFLLKTLEEDKNNNIYILVTTNLKKIPETVKSRCVNLELKKLNYKDIKKRLVYILNFENISFTDMSIENLLNFSDGSLRGILNIIEKIGYEKELNDNKINSILGLVPLEILLNLIYCIFKNDFLNTFKYTSLLINNSFNFETIIIQLQFILYKLILYKFHIKYDNYVSYIFVYLVKEINLLELQSFYYYISRGKVLINLSPSHAIGFNMLIISIFCKINKIS